MEHRVLLADGSTLTDVSVAVAKYYGEVAKFTLTSAQFIYISSRLPFNHLFFKLKTPSINTARMNVQYYDGTSWVSVVEVIDETDGFKKSGHVQFTPNRNKLWSERSTNDNGQKIAELESVVIYDQYWVRISFDADLSEVELQWLGQLFTNDDDLKVEFPDLARAKTIAAIEPGKTSWEEQHIQAAKLICTDLEKAGVITGPGQILDWRNYIEASIQKAAEVIMGSFGNEYLEDIAKAREEYKSRLSKRYFKVDKNNNAIEDKEEQTHTTGYFTR